MRILIDKRLGVLNEFGAFFLQEGSNVFIYCWSWVTNGYCFFLFYEILDFFNILIFIKEYNAIAFVGRCDNNIVFFNIFIELFNNIVSVIILIFCQLIWLIMIHFTYCMVFSFGGGTGSIDINQYGLLF